MNAGVAAALIAAGIAALGWPVTYVLARRSAGEEARRHAALQHLERQLGEFYGPMAISLLEGGRVFTDLGEEFGTEWLAGNRSLDAAETKRWTFWMDEYFFPRNERIQTLLSTKAHLIEGDEVPASFLAFVDHHSSWKLDYLHRKESGLSDATYARHGWPVEFSDEVVRTFLQLKRRHARLVGRDPRSIS